VALHSARPILIAGKKLNKNRGAAHPSPQALFKSGQKLLGFPPHPNPASITTMSWIAGLLELVGGPLLLLGLFTRPVAFLLAGEMAVAYWMAHAPRNLFPVLNGGDAAILYCFVFLYLVFAGPGPWSLDALMGRERGDASARRGLFASLRR
jgi:putative oxidoreductase